MSVFAPVYTSLFARLLANSVEVDFGHARGDCWLWCGCVSHRGAGYARISVRQAGRKHPVQLNAHRAMAELVVGHKLGEDSQTIEHDCYITPCINPHHFKLATREENTRYRFMRRAEKDTPELPWLLDYSLWTRPPYIGREMPRLLSSLTDDKEPPF